MFDKKKVIVLGERDGVAAPALAACIRGAGGDVVLAITECFA